MLVGAQVSTAGGLATGLARGEAMAAEVVQIFTQSPRQWKPYPVTEEVIASFESALRAHPGVQRTYTHATYLINLATTNDELAEKSFACLIANLGAASAIGASGVVLHVGSHLGKGLDAVVDHVARFLVGALDAVEERLGSCAPLLIENAAGTGGTVGRSFAEIGALLHAADDDPRLGTCLDTQHLFASGRSFDTIAEADAVVADFEREIGLARLGLIHLNDSKVELGANRDRHENLGEGLIGTDALGNLLSHPRLAAVPAVLEVPGSGDGPRAEDLEVARALIRAGTARRSRGRSAARRGRSA
jgi:deoxyribonuclease-4